VHVCVLVGFHVFIILMLALDLYVFRRQPRRIRLREALVWSAVWIGLALIFALGIWKLWYLWDPEHPSDGAEKATAFLAGYLVEKGLSVDNLFVFLVIFHQFSVPDHLHQRVLSWGILGAIVLRAVFILGVGATLHLVSWATYVLAIVLLVTACRLILPLERAVNPRDMLLVRLARRIFPVIPNYESSRFWVHHEGRWHATPLLLVLIAVECTDVMFAFDSIPAVFGITRDVFIVYTSNVFAIMGLRALYFLLGGFLGKLRYLSFGLAAILAFVSLKMLTEELFKPYLIAHGIGENQLILASLAVIAGILGVTALASALAGPRAPEPHDPPNPVEEELGP
jgi:tellurite resistance protein TerC